MIMTIMSHVHVLMYMTIIMHCTYIVRRMAALPYLASAVVSNRLGLVTTISDITRSFQSQSTHIASESSAHRHSSSVESKSLL